jgi:nitrogen regulatory protein P-II 1
MARQATISERHETQAGTRKDYTMKKIEAFVRPHLVEEIHTALSGVGVKGLSVLEARGFGQQKGHTEFYRGAEYKVAFVNKVKVECIVADADVERVIEALTTTAHTGSVGDGKIFVSTVEDAIRIRTGESGEAAL